MSHTPGPWTLDKCYNAHYRDAKEGTYERYQTSFTVRAQAKQDFVADIILDSDREMANANANLIAAAPELLEACKELIAVQTQFDKYTGCGMPGNDYYSNEFMRAVKLARAAIAKAEGRTA